MYKPQCRLTPVLDQRRPLYQWQIVNPLNKQCPRLMEIGLPPFHRDPLAKRRLFPYRQINPMLGEHGHRVMR